MTNPSTDEGMTRPPSSDQPNPTLHTLADWQNAYARGARPQELIPALVQRLPADDPAWIYRCTADELAAQIARLPTAGPQTPLWGVPFAAKDNIDVAGMPTTAACPAFRYIAATSATVIARLQAAGAILIGKTNLDQFATGLVGTRSPYGEVPNTLAPAYISGGSSSGSASVVARGFVPFALGTDTAGSGRVPAGLNNLVGLKPTPGRVPMAGVVPACRTLDVVSVFSLTVSDAATLMSVLESPVESPPNTPTCIAEPVFQQHPLQAPWLGGSRSQVRLGVPTQPGCDPMLGWDRAYQQALEQAQALGATVVPVDFEPLWAVARLLYDGPWVAERMTVVADLLRDQPQALDPTVAEVIAAASRYDAADVFRARYQLAALQQHAQALWQQVDALLVPTTPTCPTRQAVALAPVARNSELGRYTNFVNLLGWSALALPAYLPDQADLSDALQHGQSAVPFGVTLIGPGGADTALLAWGLRWQAHLGLPLGAKLANNVDTAVATRATSPADATRFPAAAATLQLAVVGAHLQGLPLHGQLLERGARLIECTHTAAHYRLYALPGTVPPKPGLARVTTTEQGAAIAVEVYQIPTHTVGSFLALIPPPLGLGNVELADGRWVKGFICEGAALAQATDISHHGGWRAYLNSQPRSAA